MGVLIGTVVKEMRRANVVWWNEKRRELQPKILDGGASNLCLDPSVL